MIRMKLERTKRPLYDQDLAYSTRRGTDQAYNSRLVVDSSSKVSDFIPVTNVSFQIRIQSSIVFARTKNLIHL